MIYGLTHTDSGAPIIRQTVDRKLSIGQKVPVGDSGKTRPAKLDHFLVQAKNGKGEWVEDGETTAMLTDLYGGKSGKLREIAVTLLSDEIEENFKTEYAWWSATAKLCRGNGQTAERREDAKPSGAFAVWDGPCGRECPDLQARRCKPSGDLYFMLWDVPVLGACATLHTTSYESVMRIHSSLVDLKAKTGGRLAGIPLMLVMRPKRTTYKDSSGAVKTGSAFVLNLEFRAADGAILPALLESSRTYRALPAAVEPLTEDDQAGWVPDEFHPEPEDEPAQPRPKTSQDALRAAVLPTTAEPVPDDDDAPAEDEGWEI